MQLLDRYIAKAVGGGVFAVTVVVAALLFLITFAGEFDTIGKANYRIWDAVLFVLLLVPGTLYGIFPIVTLLGTIIGLGALANSHELIIIRGAGVSTGRIIMSIMKLAIILLIFAFLLGEVISPPAQQYAKIQRAKALSAQISFNSDYGLWARDGQTYIHVQRADSQGNLHQLNLYKFDENRNLQEMLSASSATHNGKTWLLKDVKRANISPTAISINNLATLEWDTLLEPELVHTVSVEPDMLAVWKLKNYIQYLADNGLEATTYELAYWNKLAMPLTIIVMVILAVPFIMGSTRKTSIGHQILVGFMVGLVFYIANQLLGQISIVYHFHPAIGAMLPSLFVMAIALFMMRRAH